MGTNYYVVPNRPSVETPVHIGKSSIGWTFLFQSQNDTWHEPPIVWNTYKQVHDWLYEYTVQSNDYVIMDEYDRIISFSDFIELVEEKQQDEHNLSNPHLYEYCRNVDGYRFSDEWFS